MRVASLVVCYLDARKLKKAAAPVDSAGIERRSLVASGLGGCCYVQVALGRKKKAKGSVV